MSDSIPPAPVIHSSQVFTVEQATAALALNATTLSREIRKGRLRCSMRGGRRWVLGSWLLAWLESGEVERGKRPRRRLRVTGKSATPSGQ